MIEDTRKVLQDFIAPELRAIDARLTSLEKRFEEAQKHTDQRFEAVDQRFDKLEERMDRRFKELEEKMDRRFEQMDRRFEQLIAKIDSLVNYQDLQVRMTRMETLNGIVARQPKSESEAA